MVNYRNILNFYQKGCTVTQIATICECSRPTVRKTIKRAKELNLELPIPMGMSENKIFEMFCPNMGRDDGYYVPDFNALDKDKIKRSFTKYRAWEKYCRVAKRMGLKAYGKTQFYKLYKDFFTSLINGHRPNKHIVADRILAYEITEGMIKNKFGKDSVAYKHLIEEIEQWCKELRLDPRKTFPDHCLCSSK